MLRGRKILLGVSGSIAAYKAAHLTRLLVKSEAEVKVIMTPAGHDFITPLTLATLSKNPVYTEFVKDNTGQWNNHVELGLWADILIIAPASANTISKMAHGQCDNLLLATYLSARCATWVAPAMDLDMYAHPATRENINRLGEFGNTIIEAEYGELASGLVGAGRMAEPERIVESLRDHFMNAGALAGKRVMVTAGPTHEALDPVRFISNHSSGKMGYALAEELARQGADVRLVSGPTNLKSHHPNIRRYAVTSAQEMYEQASNLFPTVDIAVLAAAVADYKPAKRELQKIKKNGQGLNIELVKTQDIAEELGKIKKPDQLTVGFALETENEIDHAKGKLKSKNFDLIVLNSLNDKGAGFGFDTNKISIIRKDNKIESFGLKDKTEVAKDIVAAIHDALES